MHPPRLPSKKCDAKRMRISKKTFPDERENLLLLLLRHPYLVHGSILSARPSLSFTFSKRRSIAGPPALRRGPPDSHVQRRPGSVPRWPSNRERGPFDSFPPKQHETGRKTNPKERRAGPPIRTAVNRWVFGNFHLALFFSHLMVLVFLGRACSSVEGSIFEKSALFGNV